MSSMSRAATATHGYDYQGRRSSKTVGTTTTYLYDGLNLIREAGASTADYLFGPGIDEPLAMSRGGQVYYYGVDGLGSVATIANSGGAVQNSYLFDAWGQTRNQMGTLANPFGYTAREFGEAGALFYRARYLSPAIGRFLSEDGVRRPGSLYSYVDNDAVDWIDSDGLSRRRPTPTPTPQPPKPTPTPCSFPPLRPIYPGDPGYSVTFTFMCDQPGERLLFVAEVPYPTDAKGNYTCSFAAAAAAFDALCKASGQTAKACTTRVPRVGLSGGKGFLVCCQTCHGRGC